MVDTSNAASFAYICYIEDPKTKKPHLQLGMVGRRRQRGRDAARPIVIEDATDSTLRDASWVKRFLAHPVAFKPGTHFLYNSPATYMLSAIVQKATGQTFVVENTPGAAGTQVPLKVLQGMEIRDVTVRSIDRVEYFRPAKTY